MMALYECPRHGRYSEPAHLGDGTLVCPRCARLAGTPVGHILSCCWYCGTSREAGEAYWHGYRCRARAKAVLAGVAAPLSHEAENGILSVRVRLATTALERTQP